MTQILDGRVIRDKIAQKLKTQIKQTLRARGPLGRRPKLVIIQVGDLPESNTYIRQKVLFGEKIGAIIDHIKFPESISEENLKSKILNLNSDKNVHGIIVQQPLPTHLDKDAITDAIDPTKDIDGQTSTNIKFLFEGKTEGFVPATTKGILTLLDHYKIPIIGKHVVVIGRSSLVGKPTALAFLNRNATVTVCHSKTQDLAAVTKTADILVAAAGKPKLITKDHVKRDQVVVDVGINVIDQSPVKSRFLSKSRDQRPEMEPATRKLVGDVDFDSVKSVVAAISPVPGGCGPMTVASLFENLLEAYSRQT